MRLFSLLAIGLTISLAAGCSSKEAGGTAAPMEEAELVQANNRFAVDLYAQLCREPGNLFFSPYSVSTALGMTYAGARGTTAEQMATTLHFPADAAKLAPAFAGLNKKLQADAGKGCEILTANDLWVQSDFGLQKAFVDTARTHYQAEVGEVDFANAAEAAATKINERVARQTKGKIDKLLQPSDLTPLTRLVLTNAVYFKGDWAAQFPKAGTLKLPFYRKNGDFVSTPLMAQSATFPFWEDKQFSIGELPYVGKRLSMVVIVPKSAEGLPEIEKSLTLGKIDEWIKQMQAQRINVYLPRFKTSFRVDLKERLSEMGMPLAFDRNQADFSGIGADPKKKLHISKVLHEAFVEVNEEGTEAAGATAVIMEEKGDRVVIVPPTLRADRPFLFFIRDTSSGAILFLGRVSDPTLRAPS